MTVWKAYLGLLMAAVFWGASFVATKTVLIELSPATITVSRFGIGLLLIFLVIGIKRARRALSRQNLVAIAALGFMGITLHQWLQANGLKTAQATVGSWIVATIPIFVLILGRIVLGERLGWVRSIGIGIAGSGAIFVIGQGNPAALWRGQVGNFGDVLFVLSALNWSVFTVLSRKLMLSRGSEGGANAQADETASDGDPLGLMFVVMIFGWLFSLGWLAIDGGWRDLLTMQSQSITALLFLGIAASGLAYAFWYAGLRSVTAAQAGVFLYIEPIVTAGLAWPILGETMTTGAIVGGAGIILGVWLVNREA